MDEANVAILEDIRSEDDNEECAWNVEEVEDESHEILLTAKIALTEPYPHNYLCKSKYSSNKHKMWIIYMLNHICYTVWNAKMSHYKKQN